MVKGKGKHKIILQEPTEDDDVKLYDSATLILEEAAKNKVLVDERFHKFITKEEQRADKFDTSQKKLKSVTPPSVDLTHTPPPPYLTQIIKEVIPTLTTTITLSLTHPYLQILSAPLRSRIQNDNELQVFINQLPSLLPELQQMMVKRPFLSMEAP